MTIVPNSAGAFETCDNEPGGPVVFLIATIPNPAAPNGTQANCSIPANSAIMFPTFNVEWSAQEAAAQAQVTPGQTCFVPQAQAALVMPDCMHVRGLWRAWEFPEQHSSPTLTAGTRRCLVTTARTLRPRHFRLPQCLEISLDWRPRRRRRLPTDSGSC
jgi:hypothetical protein